MITHQNREPCNVTLFRVPKGVEHNGLIYIEENFVFHVESQDELLDKVWDFIDNNPEYLRRSYILENKFNKNDNLSVN